MEKDQEFAYTEVSQDFGRTNDTPEINYTLALDIDKKVIRIPFSNSFIVIGDLLKNYTRISSNMKKFKQKPCLRVIQGKKKMQIAPPQVDLISFCLNLKEVCFRVQDTAFPNNDASDIINMLSGEQTAKNKDDKINLILNFSGKKIEHIIKCKQTIKQLKEELVQLNQKQRKMKPENLVLQIDGIALADNKIIEDCGLENKEIKMYFEKKQGCYRANTLILTSDGTYAQIKSIQVGDRIKTLNRETLQVQDRSVISIYSTMVDECVMVKLKNNVQIYTTPNHLFLCEDGAFRLVKSSNPKEICLKQHDYLRLVTKKTVEVIEIQTKVISQIFYNVVIENGYNVIINDVISHDFSIKVQGIQDKIVYAIDASPFDNMLKIKEKLQSLLHISVKNIKLVCFAKPLSDQETISDKNFENQAVVNFSKKSVEDHFNYVSLDMPIFCKGAAWMRLNQIAQDQQLVYFNTNNNMVNNQFARVEGLSDVKVDEFVVITLNSGELKISTDSYLLTANQTVVFVMDLYKAFSNKLALPELKTGDGQKVIISNIVSNRQKSIFKRVKTSAPNIIVSNLIILKDIVNVIIRKSGRITNKICLTASKDTTFLQIKQKIQKLTQITVKNQYLSFQCNFLDDDQTLGSKKVSSSNTLIIDNCQKIHQSSILFAEDLNVIVEDKTITIQLYKENISIKYSTVSNFTVKEVLKGYLRVENGQSYVLIFSNIIVYSNQKLKKLEESPQFESPDITVIAIRNQKLSFLSAMGIQNQKIRTFSSIIFQDREQFKNLNQTSSIKVKIPAQIVDGLQKARDSILSYNHNEMFKKQHFYLPLLLFSSRKFNQEIYRNIRCFDQYRADMAKQTSVFSIIRDLYCNLNWLKNYQRICHYGLRNFRASLFFKPEHTFYFYNFTLAYEESKNVIEELKENAGTLFYIQSTSGKTISKFSLFPQKKEIMFAPFTYFLVQRVKEGELYDEVWLTEIASPVTFRKNIILWVDDNPHYNTKQYELFLHLKKSIEILQVTSTKSAEKWIQQFGWILGWKGLKFKLISDMARTEWKGQKKIDNSEAGIDLLQLLYKVKGYSTKTMIFCGNKSRALQKAESRKIPSQRYIITDDENQLQPYFQVQS